MSLNKLRNEEQRDFSIRKTNFSLENLTNFYRINGVNYRDGIYTVDLGKVCPWGGGTITQDEWIEHSLDSIKNYDPKVRSVPEFGHIPGFIVGDMPLYHAVFKTIFNNRANPKYKDSVEKLRLFLKDYVFKLHFLMTLTRIEYCPSGKDKIIHNFGMPNRNEIYGKIVGPDKFLKDLDNKSVYKAILMDDNLNEINNIYKWIVGVDVYLERLNKKPKDTDVRIAWFDVRPNRKALLDCARVLWDKGASLEVRIKRER